MLELIHDTLDAHHIPVLCFPDSGQQSIERCKCALQVVLLGQQSVGEFQPLCNGLHCQWLLNVLKGSKCGDLPAGKTCLVDRYINSTFETAPKNTIGVAFAAKKVSNMDALSHGHGCPSTLTCVIGSQLCTPQS